MIPPAFSRRMGRLTTTPSWMALSIPARRALVADIEIHETESQLTKAHQKLIAKCKDEMPKPPA